MKKIRLLIAYDGTDYAGWQRQSAASEDMRPTLQGTLESAVSKIFNSDIKVQASGRTDAGVHAEAQTVHFRIPDAALLPSSYKLLRSLNALTPNSLAILKAWEAPDEFHALLSATQKTYRYVIHNSLVPDPLNARYSYWYQKPLDVQKLNGLTECLLGEHDFKSFQTSGTEVKTTVRRVLSARWEPKSPTRIEFRITGTGFLKQMVRNIVGTTLYLHHNGYGPGDMKAILDKCDRAAAKDTAPPEGLFLESVEYPAELDNACREL